MHLKSGTNGSLALSDVLPLDGAQAKVDEALIKVNDKQTQVDTWWNGLSNSEQAKYETANNDLESAGNLLNGIDGALVPQELQQFSILLKKRQKTCGILF